MNRPMTSQMRKRYQVMMGSPAMSRKQKMTLSAGMTGPPGTTKAAMAVRLAIAQDDDADGDQDEGEERADVGEVGEGADVEEAGGNGDDESGDPGGEGRCAEERDGRCEKTLGSRPSRDMENQTRDWPIW